ncbi:MAG: ATP-binding protein [Kangiellaceae bacterium]|nr:ATP-binding protein [Kangiellaceae bacterium]MCW8997148.1 ATP-binding protein [Kangiellaceae bacterium]
MRIKLSLEAQVTLIALVLIVSIVFMLGLFHFWFENIYLASLLAITVIIPATVWVIRFYMHPINRILMALTDGFHNFLDNDFSVSIAKTRNDELGGLVDTYNKVSETLRSERLYIYQRELLLDTVIQTTPLALMLIDESKSIIYSNNAARKLVNQGKAINGLKFHALLEKLPSPFTQSVESGLNGLFTVEQDKNNETYHLTQNRFLLNGKVHHLYLFKVLTKEINRQEVNIWKKVIRLISHELNNSLAPISSLAHSGQLLSEKEKHEKLKTIFATVEERARYLQQFIEGYAKFARLPKPQISAIEASSFFENLRKIRNFDFKTNSQNAVFYADPSQLQQVLINLVKNAYESGTEPDTVTVTFNQQPGSTEIKVKDRGKGMSDKNLSNALLPFYSTKSGGTGLGLPLCREIIEAHGGKIMINNRSQGGLKVSLLLPEFTNNNGDSPDKTD